MTMKFNYFSKNGQLLPISQANISLLNIEFAYGYGVYELVRIKEGIAFFRNQHVARLLKSAEIIGIEHIITHNDISGWIDGLIEKNEINSANIKIILLGGKDAESADLFLIPTTPLYPHRKSYTTGVKTITYRYERLFPNAKTLNMLGSYLAYKKAKSNDCYDSLLIDKENTILEGTRTNFFTVKNDKIFTPPRKNILEGVSREITIHLAKKNNFEIIETKIDLKSIPDFDGAFLTSTSSKIMPVKQIDDYLFKSIPETILMLTKKYNEFLENSNGVFNP